MISSKTEQKLIYPIALLLSTANRKTFEVLAQTIQMSGDTVERILDRAPATIEDLIGIAKTIFKRKRLYLIIDDTLLPKLYSKVIPGTSDNHDSSDHRTYRSLCCITAMITDGEFSIPVDQLIWTSEEFIKISYEKKYELAQKLIEKIMKKMPIYMLLADGLYATTSMLKWLVDRSIRFEMRFHANRVINDKGATSQIRKNIRLKLSGKRPKRTIKANWYGTDYYFTAHRRVNKYGTAHIIYQISNYKACAMEHVQAYKYRWNIEKFFRTAKQKLGFSDCQSRKEERQKNHIFNVFYMYAILQIERRKMKLKNVETVIKSLKRLNFVEVESRLARSAQIFCYS
jgi:Transposase DDE domain